jgi:hypothetical protein
MVVLLASDDASAAALFLVGMYFLPTIIAMARRQSQVASIAVLNLLLGWTVLGWIAALVWSFGADRPPVVVQQFNAAPPPLQPAPPVPPGTLYPNRDPRLPRDVTPQRECPFCLSLIPEAATVCRYCRRDIPKTPGTALPP